MAKVAILGFGTVGSGVAEVITNNAADILRKTSEDIHLKYILDVRDFPGSPYSDLFIKDFSVIESDPDVDIVVETIGGAKVAYEFTRRALLAGKSVVTSNKELVATKGYELLTIAKEKNVNYLFEASVGGGIPIIRPITQCLAANELQEVYGILNGTTNYILTEMIENGTSFEDALKSAQANGYAEADPTADVEGTDACRKIAILAALCFGKHVYPDLVKAEGISKVTLLDVEYARELGYRIKLLGRALKTSDTTITAYVAPHLVSTANLLSNVDSVFNGIVVRGNAVGETMFYGPGAGKLPTASAVVADVIDCAKHLDSRKYFEWEDAAPGFVTDSELLESRWYIRVSGNIEEIEKTYGHVQAIMLKSAPEGECGFVTDVMDAAEAKKRSGDFGVLSMFRVLD